MTGSASALPPRLRAASVLLALLAGLPGCALEPAVPTGPQSLRPGAPLPNGLPIPAGRGVSLLAPLTGPNAERGQALVRAAQLALAAPGSPTLDVRDTSGTPAGAAAAAQAAIAGGAGLILGPLTGAETAAAAGPARAAGVAVLAFTNDPAQARPGVWPLGLSPTQQVRRLLVAVRTHEKSRVAGILPGTEFGNAMANALLQEASAAGLPPPDIYRYEGGTASISAAVRDASGYASRRGPLDAQIRAARARHDAEGRAAAAELSRREIGAAPLDAVLLADTGERLATLASLLPYYDIDPSAVRVLGPALWASPAARGGTALTGAWYAAPDPAAHAAFEQAYTSRYGTPPTGVADVGYDAAMIAREVVAAGFVPDVITRANGFAGADGTVVLTPDGRTSRGLAVFEIQPGGATLLEPAS